MIVHPVSLMERSIIVLYRHGKYGDGSSALPLEHNITGENAFVYSSTCYGVVYLMVKRKEGSTEEGKASDDVHTIRDDPSKQL
uniref:Uncharacterized protein n=1 Tax=Onchocerca volvulus TaxID=6282 RepID=A0A2K6WIQ7_ONCVO